MDHVWRNIFKGSIIFQAIDHNLLEGHNIIIIPKHTRTKQIRSEYITKNNMYILLWVAVKKERKDPGLRDKLRNYHKYSSLKAEFTFRTETDIFPICLMTILSLRPTIYIKFSVWFATAVVILILRLSHGNSPNKHGCLYFLGLTRDLIK